VVVTTDWHHINPFGTADLIAQCPWGKKVTGGGYYLDNAHVSLSLPYGDSRPDRNLMGWYVIATAGPNTPNGNGGHLQVWAVCGNQ
jgi:hypothetical protein